MVVCMQGLHAQTTINYPQSLQVCDIDESLSVLTKSVIMKVSTLLSKVQWKQEHVHILSRA